jgi:Domain of unknown function (DUF1963)
MRSKKPLPKPLRTLSDMEALIERTGFAPAAGLIRSRALRCWHVCNGSQPESGLIGDSRLGGSPVLEAGRPWPVSRYGRLLSFVGQFRLSDLSRVDGLHPLPATSLLSVFVGNLECRPLEALALVTPVGTTVAHLSSPPGEDLFDDPGLGNLPPESVRLEPGISLSEDPDDGWLWADGFWGDGMRSAAPGRDAEASMAGFEARPEGATGQLLGHLDFLDFSYL